MIRKSGKLLGVMIVTIGLLCGCTLAVPEQQVSTGTGDQLIGVFVTQKNLVKEHKVRIEGKLVTEKSGYVKTIAFDGIDGIGCYSLINKDTHYASTDDGLSENALSVGVEDTIEGTIYIDPTNKNNFFLNPIYQTPKGAVYLSTVNAIEFPVEIDDKGKAGATITNSSEVKLGDKRNIRVLNVQIWLGKMPRAQKMAARQYDRSGILIGSQVVDLEQLSKGDVTLKKAKNMAYAVVEADTGKEKRYSLTEEDGNVATIYAHNQRNIAVERSIFFE